MDLFFTVCASNYLAHALTLGDSIKHFHDNVEFLIVCVDDVSGLDYKFNHNVVNANTFDIPLYHEMAFKYDIIEFSTSIKPFLIEIFFQRGYSKVVYIDPDIKLYSSLDEVLRDLDQKSAILTPHILTPYLEYDGATSEEELLFVGIYNLGFFAVKNNSVGCHIVNWWKNKLKNQCYADHADALHVDQRWMDFLPALYADDILISRNPGLNYAFWNFHERVIQDEKHKFYVNGMPLVFCHFSGFDTNNPEGICRKQSKYKLSTHPEYSRLFMEYLEHLEKNGLSFFKSLKYSFNYFNNGTPILKFHRRLFRALHHNYSNPFETGSNSYYDLMKKNKLLIHNHVESYGNLRKSLGDGFNRKISFLIFCLKCIFKIIGVGRYYLLMRFFEKYHRFENQSFLIKNK